MSPCIRRALLVLAAFTLAPAAEAQNTHVREGFWFNVGLGVGSLGCNDCSERTNGMSGGLALGGSINQHVSLGIFANGWSKSENGATLTAAALTAGLRWYPSATGGFFVLGGLGMSQAELNVSGLGSASESGTGAVLGLGWDIRVAKNVSMTPFWNGFAASFSGGDANVGQIGVGLTIH
jgi:hypothetical protein